MTSIKSIKNNRFSILIFLGPIFMWAASVMAQERADEVDSIALEPVLVTSTRVVKDLSEVPLSVSVVSEKQIEEKPMPETIDYLRETPGVQVNRNSLGFYTFSIRGNGTGRTLVLVDGVKQKIATAYFEDEAGQINVDPSEIERIEVIKGPASALYGSDAMGGVINVITKKGGDKPVGGSVGLKYDGSNESLVPRAAIFGTYKGFYYRASGVGFKSKDKILQNRERLRNSDERRENYAVKFGYEWNNGSFDFAATRFSGWANVPAIYPHAINDREQIPASIVGDNYSSRQKNIAICLWEK